MLLVADHGVLTPTLFVPALHHVNIYIYFYLKIYFILQIKKKCIIKICYNYYIFNFKFFIIIILIIILHKFRYSLICQLFCYSPTEDYE